MKPTTLRLVKCGQDLGFTVLVFLLVVPTIQFASPERVIPGLRNRSNFHFSREGDVNIAHFASVHESDASGRCSKLLTSGVVQSEVLKFAVAKVNNRTDLLPNITIGFHSLDDCWNGQKALEVAVYLVHNFIRRDGTADVTNGSNCPKTNGQGGGEWPGPSIAGVLGPSNSPMSVSVSPYFGVFNVPVLSLYATSDDLSDKTRYEYFVRLVPPDSFQERTLLEISKRLGWNYLGMVYTEGAYGENAASQIDRFLRNGDYNICISMSIRVPSDAGPTEYAGVIRRLHEARNSRVVLTFLQGSQQETFFATVRQLVGLGRFLFLSGDTLQNGEGEVYADVLEGSIYTDMPARPIPGFLDYETRRSPSDDPEDVWMREVWESRLSDCSSSKKSASDCTFTSEVLANQRNWNMALADRTYDGVFVYAHALDRLIRDVCPSAFADRSLLADCLDGSILLRYLKNTSVDGIIGKIRFNGNGDMIGDIVINQYQSDPRNPGAYVYVTAGNWTSSSNAIYMDMKKLDWKAFRSYANGSSDSVLESVCSQPCQKDEYAIRQDTSCCWLCIRCRDNEIVNQNATGCQPCPLYTWPDRSNTSSTVISTCLPISPTYLRPDNPISVTLIFLSVVGVMTSVTVMVVYRVKRDHRLVKATSRELSLLILLGTLMASVAVMFFVVLPANGICVCRSVGFHAAINLLYGPLLVKNIRTYRIFRAGHKSVKIPAGVGKNSQLVYVAGITCLQVVLIGVSESLDPSLALLKMPTTYEMYVEIYCKKTAVWFLVPLAFNISLIMLCAALGYATRKLPENFNESGFIFVSVATTLFAWVVFIPAYYSAVYAHLQSAILGFCLVLNAFVTLGCQFVRIVYAVYFVAPDRISFSTATTTAGGGGVTVINANCKAVARVAPADVTVTKVTTAGGLSESHRNSPPSCGMSTEIRVASVGNNYCSRSTDEILRDESFDRDKDSF